MTETLMTCPRCGTQKYTPREVRTADVGEAQVLQYPYPALSRVADIDICSPCGQEEAMRDWGQLPPIPPDEWPIDLRRFQDANQGFGPEFQT